MLMSMSTAIFLLQVLCLFMVIVRVAQFGLMVLLVSTIKDNQDVNIYFNWELWTGAVYATILIMLGLPDVHSWFAQL